ncbi:MAG: aldolase [Caldilineaceae bacterium SB0668_bin_21]|nr:aldolase [Caldilineaceae bacterium SB0668_bin_21]MYC21518.1 aldolase [Caldilineaceae bacterium SB0662_bin_25]
MDDRGRVELLDGERVRADLIDTLVRDAVFGTFAVKTFSRWLIWELGQLMGACPASIHEFYIARADNAWTNRTVPAMNMRFSTYEAGRAAYRAAQRTQTGAFIFEIARSEMGYTFQEPAEFSAVLIAAAIKEGYRGPIFIQGDHFQVDGKKYRSDPEGALNEVKALAKKALAAGYWNIDIDTSTLVTLEPASLDEQQRENYLRSAMLTKFIRDLEPEGVTISLGGEIGEVGEKNSTVPELDAYIHGYKAALGELGDYAGLSKISVATGTAHGGILLPDGTQADVAVDFDTLEDLGERARFHGSGGAVQHGASTLPEELFSKFPETQTIEIHLATGFTNTFLDHPSLPDSLRQEMYAHLEAHHADERGANDSDLVFHLKTRKKALGPFKPELWALPRERVEAIFAGVEEHYAFFYEKLNVVGTRELVDGIVTPVAHHRPMPVLARGAGDDQGLAD